MRRSIFLTALAMAAASSAIAQDGFKFGLKTGLNVTTFNGNDNTWLEREEGFVRESTFKPGAHVGVSMNLGFGRHGNSSLTADVLFSMKGSGYKYNDYYFVNETDTVAKQIDVKESVTRLCVDVPILYRYRTNFGLYGEAGIYISIAVGTSLSNDDPRATDLYMEIEEAQYKPLDLGFTAGAGWISDGGLGLGVRGFTGFLDQYETWDDPLDQFDLGDVGQTWNFGFQLSGMYYFGWGGRSRR
ncbi:MAG: PorT family protein [Flavobacteriales bacterium]|nr:PorT family protein [Flavobacteriales bacterium]